MSPAIRIGATRHPALTRTVSVTKNAATTNKIWPPAGPVAVVDPVVTVGLNVHSAPGQDHPVISSVYEGDKLAVLARTTNWERVLTRDGTKGWVLRRFLDEAGSRKALAAAVLTAQAPVLNVRNGPGLQYGVSGAVFKGTKMTLVRATPHWAAVVLPGGTTGWVALPMTSGLSQAATPTTVRAASVTAAGQQQTFVQVIASVLNIRSGPGQNHTVVAQVLKNTRLQVLDVTAHWVRVALPASTIDGWVLRLYTR